MRPSFQGAVAVAFERDRMLVGDPANMVKFGPLPCNSECFFSLQPSHLEGPPPPVGTPNTFIMAFDDQTWGTSTKSDSYRLWDFDVDWATPANSTFTSLGQINTTDFDAELCGFSRNCIPQPSPGEGLDSLSQFTMYRAQFRDFVDYQTLLINHTVDAGQNTAGIRWTELRNTGSGWVNHQTGTFGPLGGGLVRMKIWLGSIPHQAWLPELLQAVLSSLPRWPRLKIVRRC